jgi:lipoate-protein ligase A
MRPTRHPVDVVDTGLASGIHNAAIDRSCLELRAQGMGRDLLRFHRSRPVASIGRQQALDREVRVDYCSRQGIEIVRRPTSGGALYLDPGQLGFSLIIRRPVATRGPLLRRLLECAGNGVAAGLRQLGIAATFKAPNDVEVGGAKIASVFATSRGDAWLLHGSVLLDVDVATMLKTLRVPTEKLSPDGLATARERLAAVHDLCPNRPAAAAIRSVLTSGIAAQFGLITRSHTGTALPPTPSAGQLATERALASLVAWDRDDEREIEALIRTAGGTIRARASFSTSGDCLNHVEIAADVQVEPPDFFNRLQIALRGSPVPQLGQRISDCLRRCPPEAFDFGAAELTQLLLQLADKHRFAVDSGMEPARASALMPCIPAAGPDTSTLLAQASVMLVPYCAKPAWCKWRHRDGCTECGMCEVGAAYALARERNMQVTTITNYEHLVATLGTLKANRVQAYLGMCCSHFFIKRYRAFAEAGVPALLMDISGSNCYELQQEAQAYSGTFSAEARIDTGLLAHVMRFVPRRSATRNEKAGH